MITYLNAEKHQVSISMINTTSITIKKILNTPTNQTKDRSNPLAVKEMKISSPFNFIDNWTRLEVLLR